MDFFEYQEAARRRTGWLIFLFTVAVVMIVLSVYAIVAATLGKPWDPAVFAAVAAGTLMVISAGSVYKTWQLASGGEPVALMLGGRLVDPHTIQLAERRLLNVVEEMALASGVPVPPVYVLENEPSINAFAAGHDPSNAVIGVSRGCLDHLTRDELQGVMGHEFSHILNGDMRLNLRLVGILHGILLLAIIGYYILRSAGSGRSSRSGRGGGALMLTGLGLLIIGYVGLFFGKLIRASVSRQREYLADASAVQFTRNPAGLAGALKKIGGLVQGSRIRDVHAAEVSHLFFGDAFAGSFFNWFATHPPLAKRVRRIEPDFDGAFPVTKALVEEEPGAARAEPAPQPARGPGFERLPGVLPPGRGPISLAPGDVAGRIGMISPVQLAFASAILEQMPHPLSDAATEPYGARAIVYAILLSRDAEVRSGQLALLQARVEEPSYRETLKLLPMIDRLPEEARVPLVERALPALKRLSADQYAAFRDHIEALVKADGKMDLLEYTVQNMLFRALDVHFGRAKPPRISYYAMRGVLEPMATVLSVLAREGQKNEEEIRRAFELGVQHVGQTIPLLAKDQCTLKNLDRALQQLAEVAPKVKRQAISACVACIAADGTVTVREGELLRAITATLGCPMPPLVAPLATEG